MLTEDFKGAMSILQDLCHSASHARGWWNDPITGESLIPGNEVGSLSADAEYWREIMFPYVVGTKIALIHSEVTEMLESHRTGSMDDKIPFPGTVAEGADVIIRVLDLIGMMDSNNATAHGFPAMELNFNVGEAIVQKLNFNLERVDHNVDIRRKPGGKKY